MEQWHLIELPSGEGQPIWGTDDEVKRLISAWNTCREGHYHRGEMTDEQIADKGGDWTLAEHYPNDANAQLEAWRLNNDRR